MNKLLKIIFVIIIAGGLFTGVRFIGSLFHYSCHPDRIVNTEDGDDCAPPFVGIGELSFYLTGGSLMPFLNHDATTVRKVNWEIEKANPSITSSDDYHFYEDRVVANVTTYDGKTKAYDLGTSYGCTGTTTSELQNRTIVIGRVDCNFAETGVTFTAFKHAGGFSIERRQESAQDGSVATTTLVQI